MTLFKISLRNAKRQTRDYLVYFATVVMAAALLYAFNGLVFSEEIAVLASGMRMLPLVIVMASGVVVCIFGWLVAYATGFMLQRRSRELGTYLLAGLESRQVARLFFLENLAVGSCALLLGLLLGGLLYQAFRAIILTMFGLPYHFCFAFSFSAIALTAVYFGLIYLYALYRSRRRIRKMKICDLLYFDRRNEEAVIRTGRGRRWIFTLSLVLGVLGIFLLTRRDVTIGMIGAGILILFLFGFFLSFASAVPAFFDRRPKRKYRGQNLLVFRTLTAKLATMGVLMAVLSLVFTATLITEGMGLVVRGIFTGRAAENACFDLYIGIEGREPDPEPYLAYVEKHIPVEQGLLYPVFLGPSSQHMDYVSSCTAYYYYNYDRDPVLRYSDYAALREIAGYPAVEEEAGRYLIHCMTYLEEPLRGYKEAVTLGGETLLPGSVYTEHLSQSFGVGNGRGLILVVPDEAAEGLPVHHLAYAARTAEPVAEAELMALKELIPERSDPDDYVFMTTKAHEEAEVASQTALTVFPLFFLALALAMTAATILTIRQLSESERYRRQFGLLHKLGMDRREAEKALRNQFAIYYAMPAVPTVLIGVPFVLNLAGTPEPGVMVGSSSPANITGIALGIFFLVYGIYMVLAYVSLKRNVMAPCVR